MLRLWNPISHRLPSLVVAATFSCLVGCASEPCHTCPRANEGQTAKSADAGWTPLFNGKDTTGWINQGKSSWKIQDGMLVGRQGENYAPGDLLTEKTYRDFELTCTYKMVWPGNSGIWFRYQSAAKNYQADILEWPNPVCYSGTLYCQGKMFIAMNTDPSIVNKTGWNTMKVRAEGDHLQVWLNGHKTADLHDDTCDEGRIGFQIHPGEQFNPMEITIKEIKVRTLKEHP